MFFLTRRKMIAGVSASAAASVAGCVSSNPDASVNAAAAMAPSPSPSPAHPAVMADAIEPQYNAVYSEVKDGTFIVPAVQLSQVNSAFLRTNVAYATTEIARHDRN